MTKEKIAKWEQSDWYKRMQAFKLLINLQDKQSDIRRVDPEKTWNTLVDCIKKNNQS